jgi:hypothetical protein
VNATLFIPSSPADPATVEHHSCRVAWPCGDEPYASSLRKCLYRRRYTYPRIGLWGSVCLSPQLIALLMLPFETWSFPQRVVTSLFVLLLCCAVAYVLDACLYGQIYDGQRGVPDSPCINRAEQAAYEWRSEWISLETDAPLTAGSIRFGLGPRLIVPWSMVETTDLSRVFQGLDAEAFIRTAAMAAAAMRDCLPNTLVRKLMFDRRPSVVVLTPMDTPPNQRAYVWQLFSEPMADRPGALHRAGMTYWFAGGPLVDRTVGKSDARVTKGHMALFADRSLFWPCLIALLGAWPIGVCWLAWKAIQEVRFGERYRDFVANYSPALGDSLDLWLISRAREMRPHDFVTISTDITREAQHTTETARSFLHQAYNGGYGSTGDGV